MKFTKLFAAVALMASAFGANAADLERTVTVDLNGLASFDTSFNSNRLQGLTFLDTFNFTLSGQSNLGGALSSLALGQGKDLAISTFSLYSGNTLVSPGTQFSTGLVDIWGLNAANLGAGNYSLKIGGTILGNGGGSFQAGVTVSPVPEPETWSMMAVSMAALGLMARRRKSKAVKSNAVAA